MLEFALWGFILWVLLLWRINSKTVTMPVKGEELPSAAEEDVPTARSPDAGMDPLSTVAAASQHAEHNVPQAASASAGLYGRIVDSDALQGSMEANSKPPTVLLTTQKPSKSVPPMLSSGPKARERLKFILGASEDNSSDEEPLITKPPSGASQPPTSTIKSSPPQAPSVVPQPSSTVIK